MHLSFPNVQTILVASLALWGTCWLPAFAVDNNDGADLARQTLAKYCNDCHTGEKAEGGVRLEFLARDGNLEEHIELVDKIILVLKEQQMPPADAEQPDGADRVKTIEWIEQRLREFDCGAASRPGRVTMRRLNRTEYNNTVRDLTGLDLQLANDFPSDDVGNGFDNIGDVLSKTGLADPQSKKSSKALGGDRTLALIDIPDATVTQSTSVLAKMLVVHIAVAWIGLLFNKSSP